MSFPIDALTQTDKDALVAYCSLYGNTIPRSADAVLQEWNKNKRTLFKAFGRKLRIYIPYEVTRDKVQITNELGGIYNPYTFWYDSDVSYVLNNKEGLRSDTNSDFITELSLFLATGNFSKKDRQVISRLFLHQNIVEGHITTISSPYRSDNFKSTLKPGMKTIRTIQKVLQAIHFPRMDLFEQWRDEINKVSYAHTMKTNLVLSIHPMDFLTMSDNACNWSSCMSWKKNGCYHSGTIEMMNSNVAIVAYLEAGTPWTIQSPETEECFDLSNKSWRCLYYLHKDMILAGKSYPYYNQNVTLFAMDQIRELVKTNLHWDYQFINQRYYDMIHTETNHYVRDYFMGNYKPNHHSIVFYTNAMYNDMAEAVDDEYWCCRNYVKKTKKICVSGACTCMCCGDRIEEPCDIDNYETIGSTVTCYNCRSNHTCEHCGKVVWTEGKLTEYGYFCSEACLHEEVIFPEVIMLPHHHNVTMPMEQYMRQDRAYFLVIRSKDEYHHQYNHYRRILDEFAAMEKVTPTAVRNMVIGEELIIIPTRAIDYPYMQMFSGWNRKNTYTEYVSNRSNYLFIVAANLDKSTIKYARAFSKSEKLDEFLARKEEE